ncbi:MAG: zinc ribbon domain-containing protein [Desulfurella sp.]|uniref:zinc ribbon domain-containing protein n=1 Tax=Desulfurella sp. TaxID=1962857 RepID=UPI003D10C27F
MNADIEMLLKIQEYDKQIYQLESEFAKRLQDRENLEELITTHTLNMEQLQDELNEILEDLKFKKNLLEEKEALLEKLDEKSNSVQNQKQSEALSSEITIAKTNKSILEDKILEIQTIVDEKNKKISEIQQQIDEVKQKLESFDAQLAEFKKDIDNKIEQINKEKEIMLNDINPHLLAKYNKISLWAKGSAVVRVENETCYGCFIKLPPQISVLVEETDEIVYCPNCGRILYKKE